MASIINGQYSEADEMLRSTSFVAPSIMDRLDRAVSSPEMSMAERLFNQFKEMQKNLHVSSSDSQPHLTLHGLTLNEKGKPTVTAHIYSDGSFLNCNGRSNSWVGKSFKSDCGKFE